MGIRITGDEGKTALYDSVSGFAFGLVFDNSEEANDFLEFAGKNEPRDLRVLSDSELEKLYCKWVNQVSKSQLARAKEVERRKYARKEVRGNYANIKLHDRNQG